MSASTQTEISIFADQQRAEVAKFQTELIAHFDRKAQFQHEKDAHAAELKLAADAQAMQAKRDADHIEALVINKERDESIFRRDYDEAAIDDLRFDIDVASYEAMVSIGVDIEPDVCDGPTDEDIIEFCEEHGMSMAKSMWRLQKFIDDFHAELIRRAA